MTCVFPVCAKDVHLLTDLLLWIKQLGGCKNHRVLIVADGGVPWEVAVKLMNSALESFGSVDFTTNGEEIKGWIPGSNSLWKTAGEYCLARNMRPWLFMEPDATPIKSGWLDEIQGEWDRLPIKPIIFAHQYRNNDPKFPEWMMSGVAVYDTVDFSLDLSVEAFDVVTSKNIKAVANTSLIQHFWGEPGLPPTFKDVKTPASPRNTFTLFNITPEAVIFHRCKDGSLIRLLRHTKGIKTPYKSPFITVLPVCNKDVDLMIKCLRWMVEMEGNNGADALLSYDTSLHTPLRNIAFKTAAEAFGMVTQFTYPRPPAEVWPDACNWAFQYTAKHIAEKIKRPWFWMEADMVPLKPGWLRVIQDDYVSSGMKVYGPVVHPPGHINGTAIYPADFAEISPGAMNASSYAWDTSMTKDIQGISYDGSRLIQHAWGMVEGRLDETTGPAPHFADKELVERWIRPEAVIFHRCKDGSLIDRLREMRR